MQKVYTQLFNKQNLQAQLKESLFVVQIQRSLICSLQTIVCYFVGQPHKSAAPSLKFCTNMKSLRGRKLTKEKPNFFSALTLIIMCSKKLKICLGQGSPSIMKNTSDYLPLWVEQKNKVSATFEKEFGTKYKDGKNLSYCKREGKYSSKWSSNQCPLSPWHVSNSQRVYVKILSL